MHSVVIANVNQAKYLIDLGNRLNPLPLVICLDIPIGGQSTAVEAGDTYTFVKRTAESNYERWVGYSLTSEGEIRDPLLFNSFSLKDEINLFNELVLLSLVIII